MSTAALLLTGLLALVVALIYYIQDRRLDGIESRIRGLVAIADSDRKDADEERDELVSDIGELVAMIDARNKATDKTIGNLKTDMRNLADTYMRGRR